MITTTNVCPFTEATTIASTCNKVFSRNFLKPNTIGIIPKNGYRWRDNQSIIGMKWLVWEEHQRDINIIHAAKQQEVVVCGVKVDGFCPETKQIFEFHGCYFHGCPICFKYNRDKPLFDNSTETLDLRHESTVAKTEHLRSMGYQVFEMRECRFRMMLKENTAIETFTNSHPLLLNTPLIPRDAFYGGRTGNTHTYYKCKPGETIKYVDVCSLYPWVCKYGKFPVGHPKLYIGRECDRLNLSDICGLIKCKILPPQDLYHPVLPYKTNNKLMFVLCQTCGKEMNTDECRHSEEERALIGTWVVEEVTKAIEKGYRVLEIYEIWVYDNVQQLDKISGSDGLFTAMMDKFIKIKQEASGWPQNCCTPEERERYIKEFLEIEDIKLEFTEIIGNPGLRALAKLMLNSFWGKFGQRENQPRTKIINEPNELYDILSNPCFIVNTLLPINERTVLISYQMTEDAYSELSTVNVVIAGYTTALARLKLYSYLEKLGNRILYFDTDSAVYVSREEEYDIPTGSSLGEMTDELETFGPGSYISEFVSGGPKNYAYKVFSTNTQSDRVVCKVKGISLNYSASQLINFDSIKNMILSPSDPVHITFNNIRRTKEHNVVTREDSKIYRPNSTKRKFFDDHSSLPFGYKKCRK